VIIPVAVEKLAYSEFAKIGSRQEALETIFPSLLDIFYHPIFDFFQKNRLFQQPPLFSTVIATVPFQKLEDQSAGINRNAKTRPLVDPQ
jgi:hypothetical protein